MSQAWQIEQTPQGVRLSSLAVTFRVTPQAGGIIDQIRYSGLPNVSCVPAQISSTLLQGEYYNRHALNQLLGQLPAMPADSLTWQVQGDQVEVLTRWQVHDLNCTRRIRVPADGKAFHITERIEKTGPGSMRIQPMHTLRYPLADRQTCQPGYMAIVPQGDCETMHWAFSPSGQRIIDQDGHPIYRRFVLSSPWIASGVAGESHVVRTTVDTALACGLMHTAPKGKSVHIQLYGIDVQVSREQPLERAWSVSRPRPYNHGQTLPAAPPVEPRRHKQLGQQARALRQRLAGLPDDGNRLMQIRRGNIQWKLGEFDWYLAIGEHDQAHSLLADAEVIFDAIDARLPAALPQSGNILYESDMTGFPRDWQVFGYAELDNDPQKGLHLKPVVTVDMWTRQQFKGDLMVTFDYCSTNENQVKGGTFLQLSGQVINPGDHEDFMASATGYMPNYNFGTYCYHLSFNRGDPVKAVCNFRKTGRDFYVLAQIPEKTFEPGCWHRIAMVRRGNQFLYFLDGELRLEYLEHGHQGPILDQGHIGIRNWGRRSSWIRNFRVSAI